MRSNLPKADLFLGKSISRFPNHVMQKHVASGNNGHLFYAFDASTNSELAFTIAPVDNLPRNPDDQYAYLNEAKKANLLMHLAVVGCVDVVPFAGPCSSSEEIGECVVFVYHYVKGMNLRAYMKEHRSDINLPFIEHFLRTMLELLYELQQRGEQHGDLHAGNVLVAQSEFDIYNRTTFRVTDFGVRKLTGHAAHASDYLYTADTLRQLLECIEYRDSEGRDRYVRESLRHDFLERHLIETDAVADPFACNPRALLDKLDSAGDAYRTAAKAHTIAKLVKPFDYPNCEQMGKSHLLLKSLYSDRVLGLSEIQARSNLVLTGPRGCGKTTVFRALSLDYLLSTGADHPNSMDYIGIYYRCDDLYFSFPRYKRPDRPEALDVPMHFLIVTLLATTLEQISSWARKHFAEECKKKEESLVASLWDILELRPPDSPSANRLTTLINRLLMYRSADVFFKLSTESPVSFARQDVDGKRFIESREYDILNLGIRYLTDGSNQALAFLEELFNRRFREVEGYPVQTLTELLGSITRNETATARAFRAFRQHKGQEPNYAGCETVAAMCSGDIHYMIRLVSRMVEDYGGHDRLAASDATPRIPPQRQHDSIRAAAGAFMESVRTLPRWGARLADVVTGFGNVAHSYLMYETAKNEMSYPPHQASRIEPYDALRLSDEAQEILHELLRYSVLIEDPRGMSRRGKIVPRYYLRRYLIPHFRLTFSRRDSLELENDQIERLLCKPQQFEDAMRLKSEEDAARRRGRNPDQTELFQEE